MRVSRDELEHYWPTVRPRYSDPRLDPYRQEIGKDEASDPLHFGASLLDAICATPRQEIGSQTFSHFYCLAAGQAPNEFAADLESAVCIARERGVQLRSLVMPRNEWNPEYAGIVRSAGFSAYRGNQPGWMHRATHTPSPGLRAARLLDAYRPISGTGTFGWQEIREDTGLCNIRASAFLRPCQPFLTPVRRHKIRRIQEGMSAAARTRSLYHLWWHPHNFGRHPRASLELLEDLLAHFTTLRRQYGFQSMSMREVAAAWGGGNGPVPPPRDPEPAAEGRVPGD